jgi:hypothetical protein
MKIEPKEWLMLGGVSLIVAWIVYSLWIDVPSIRGAIFIIAGLGSLFVVIAISVRLQYQPIHYIDDDKKEKD